MRVQPLLRVPIVDRDMAFRVMRGAVPALGQVLHDGALHPRMAVRVVVEGASEPLGARIRKAKMDKLPYVLVVGDDDVANQTVGINARGAADPMRGVAVEDFATRLLEEIATRSLEQFEVR